MHVRKPRNRRHQRAGAGGDDDAPGRKRAFAAIAEAYFHGPGGGDLRVAFQHIHTQPGITLHRIVRLDGVDHRLHPFHHVSELETRLGALHTEFARAFHMRQELG